MSVAIPILSGLRRPSIRKNVDGNRSASKETVASTAALRLRDVMTLPFVYVFFCSTNAASAVAEPTFRTFRPSQLSGAISNVPVDDHFPVISRIRRRGVGKTDARSGNRRRLPEGAASGILTPLFALIRPTPQDAINLPFTFVS